MYVVMVKDKFAKKKSYGDWYIVDTPERATLYSRLKDAQQRRNDMRSSLARGLFKKKNTEKNEVLVKKVSFTHTLEDV